MTGVPEESVAGEAGRARGGGPGWRGGAGEGLGSGDLWVFEQGSTSSYPPSSRSLTSPTSSSAISLSW